MLPICLSRPIFFSLCQSLAQIHDMLAGGALGRRLHTRATAMGGIAMKILRI